MKIRIFDGLVSRALRLFSSNERRKILAVSLLQIFISFLELASVLLVGLFGLLLITNSSENTSFFTLDQFFKFFGLTEASFSMKTLILSVIAITILIVRTIVSVYVTRRILLFFGNKSAVLSEEVLKEVLSRPILDVQSVTSHASLFALTRGIDYLTMKVLGTLIVLISDFSTLIVLVLALLVINPISAIGTMFLFGLIGYLLHRRMGTKAQKLGEEFTEYTIKGNEAIDETIASYRELFVHDRIYFQASKVGKVRKRLAHISAELDFMPYISKYTIEATLLIGTIFLALLQFNSSSVGDSIFTLTLFISAGVRIAPSILRLQQGVTLIRGSSGIAKQALELVESMTQNYLTPSRFSQKIESREVFVPEIIISNVTFKYPSREINAIQGISLHVPPGSSCAIIGPSGSGKTTLLDVVLGIIEPDSGEVLVNKVPSLEAIKGWPGSISYVPQSINIVNNSILENICLGYDSSDFSVQQILHCIELADLDSFVASLPEGIYTQVGENGSKLSGGQRQRIGIARALLTQPSLIVLDEATSHLDMNTENSIVRSLERLHGTTSVISIAHRLETIRNMDQIVCLDGGRLIAIGDYKHIMTSHPELLERALIKDA
jgi:ATP-binding cassette, subfamily B, bacterial PglK